MKSLSSNLPSVAKGLAETPTLCLTFSQALKNKVKTEIYMGGKKILKILEDKS